MLFLQFLKECTFVLVFCLFVFVLARPSDAGLPPDYAFRQPCMVLESSLLWLCPCPSNCIIAIAPQTHSYLMILHLHFLLLNSFSDVLFMGEV